MTCRIASGYHGRVNRVRKPLKLNILHAAQLSKFPWLVHGFSTRLGGFSRTYGGGALNLGFTKDDSKAAVERNRAAFLRGLGAVNSIRRRKFENLASGHAAPGSFRHHPLHRSRFSTALILPQPLLAMA